MNRSKMLQLKISKTKKRLSDAPWLLRCQVVSVIGLLSVMVFCLRAMTLSWNFSLVKVSLPVMEVPLEEVSSTQDQRPKEVKLGILTPVIAVTQQALIFGTAESFSSSYLESDQKWSLPHRNGKPQLKELAERMKVWHEDLENIHRIKNQGIAVVLASDQIPMAIVIQVIQHLKDSALYRNIVIGQSLI